MSNAADKIREKARKAAEASAARTGINRSEDPDPGGPEDQVLTPEPPMTRPTKPATAAKPPVRKVRTLPVRITVDLPPVDHLRLKNWCTAAANQLGRGAVPGAEVVRVLLARMDSDPELARQVLADIARKSR